MTAALTGRPLLAMLFIAYLCLVAFVAAFCGARDAERRCPYGLRHDDDPDWWQESVSPLNCRTCKGVTRLYAGRWDIRGFPCPMCQARPS